MTESLQDRIIRHEGFIAIPKYDAKGFFVVGFGHDIPRSDCDKYASGISVEAATQLLEQDIQIATNEVSRILPWTSVLSDIRLGILIEMCFQLGINGLLGFHDMLSCLKDNDFDGAAENMLSSQWHHQTPARCEELAELMKTGE